MSTQAAIEVTSTADAPAVTGGRLGVATWVTAVARFIVVLDGTIMFVAIPSIQRSPHMSAANLAWVINAYSLTFGGLMLVAGRVGDVLGRKNVFRFGLATFGAASLLGGLAPNGTALILLRGLQGIGAAIAVWVWPSWPPSPRRRPATRRRKAPRSTMR